MTTGSVDVSVPATSANLGPGFDCLGVALGLRLRVRFSASSESAISGKGRVRAVEDSLIFRSYCAAFEVCALEPPPVLIEVTDEYPSGRGLGASASAIVAGLVGANAGGLLSLSQDDLAGLATEIEGHPDNVLPALLGGLVVSYGVSWTRLEPSPTLSPVVLVAAGSFKTKAARKVLPQSVSREDAISNTAAAVGLVSIISGIADSSNLMEVTSDRLHEPYRLPLMPESLGLHKALRDKGIATVLSGAGPSLLCLVPSDSLSAATRMIEDELPPAWELIAPGWDLEGAQASSVGT